MSGKEHMPLDSKKVSLLPSRRHTENEAIVNEFKNFIQKQIPQAPVQEGTRKSSFYPGITIQSPEKTVQKAKELPKVTCVVSQNVVARDQGEDDVKILYHVKTQVDDETFTKLHKYANFLDLEEYIEWKCNPRKAPWFEVEPPSLQKIDFDEYEDEQAFINARVRSLGEYINTLISDPKYMIDRVLDFLGIQDEHKDPFLVYNAHLKATTPRARGLRYLKPALEMQTFSKSITKKQSQLPFFRSYCSHQQPTRDGDSYEYIFVIKDENDPMATSWKITKDYQDFKSFHEKLEKAIGRRMTVFEEFVPKQTDQNQAMDLTFVEKRKIGLEKYMDSILGHRKYYKEVLYEFLEYNKDNITHTSRSMTPRSSFYGEYE